MMNGRSSRFKSGFTIVELLVVIVVIGILAAITIVAYGGIQNRATIASLSSDLSNAAKILKLDQISNSAYPATLAAANGGKGISASPNTTYQYVVNNNNPKTFCVSATKSGQTYNIDQDSVLTAGNCPVLRLDANNPASYPGSGLVWTDLSGNVNNGTLTGGVGYSSSNGGSLSFDGVDDWVNGVTQPAIQTSPNVFTVTGIIYPDNLSSRIITPASNGYDQDISYDAASQMISIKVAEASNLNQRSRTTPVNSVPLNAWTYWAISVNDKHIKMYINGALVAEYSETINIATWSGNWVIGQRGISTMWYKGLMASIRVYSSELLSSDIAYNFNVIRGRYGL